jgi:hypothetical protein
VLNCPAELNASCVELNEFFADVVTTPVIVNCFAKLCTPCDQTEDVTANFSAPCVPTVLSTDLGAQSIDAYDLNPEFNSDLCVHDELHLSTPHAILGQPTVEPIDILPLTQVEISICKDLLDAPCDKEELCDNASLIPMPQLDDEHVTCVFKSHVHAEISASPTENECYASLEAPKIEPCELTNSKIGCDKLVAPKTDLDAIFSNLLCYVKLETPMQLSHALEKVSELVSLPS